ncbi:MAG: hypothetical protein F6K14_08625 [Symploca sp. SIO2C1]|nr:hypothetical protein [Symploca sp. SIO2C1]
MNIFTQQLTQQDIVIESLLSQLTEAKARKENLEQSQATCQTAIESVEAAIKEIKNQGIVETLPLFRAELEQLFDGNNSNTGSSSDPPEPEEEIICDSDSGMRDIQNAPHESSTAKPLATIQDPETGTQYTVTAVEDSQTGELQYAATTVAPAPTDNSSTREQEASSSVVEAELTDNQDKAEHPDIVHLGKRVIYLRNVGEYAMTAWFGFDLIKNAKAFIKDAQFAFYHISKAELKRSSTRTGCKVEVVVEGDLEISRIEGAARKLFDWQPPEQPKPQPKPEVQEFNIAVSGHAIQVEYTPRKIGDSDHLAFRSPYNPPRPIPVSQTGYRSHFCTNQDIEAVGTPEDYAIAYCHALLRSKKGQEPSLKQVVAVAQEVLPPHKLTKESTPTRQLNPDQEEEQLALVI